VSVTLEATGRRAVYETWDDGETYDWGRCSRGPHPPGSSSTWEIIQPGVTEVELTFRALAPSLTRVELEHRGWDKLTDAEVEQLGKKREN